MRYEILRLALMPTGAEHMGAVEMGWEPTDQEFVDTLDEAKEAVMRAYTPFDHPDGRDINQRCLFLDGTPHHIERYRTTGWRHIDETGGSAMLPDGTMVLVQSSGASDETDQPKGTG